MVPPSSPDSPPNASAAPEGRDPLDLLWPPPRSVTREEGPGFVPRREPRIAAGPPGFDQLWQRARSLFGPPAGTEPGPALSARFDPALAREDYALTLTPDKWFVESQGELGLFRALTTLAQLLHLVALLGDDAAAIPCTRIEDGPVFPQRGFHLDISRSRVPTQDELRALVDRLAAWKLNQLQLYVEHAFAYPSHPLVWRDASPLTPDEVRELDAYAAERFVELVPNQQSFGHLHRWLRHKRYRSLAECPDGVEHPFSNEREPFSLCPTDKKSITFLSGLYDELLPNFQSTQLNVGLDETFDLGEGRSAKACQARGKEAVYIEFLHSVHGLAAERGRRVQFWADIILNGNSAEPVRLPDGAIPLDAIPLIWGYEADHPFDEQCAAIGALGNEFYVCPGTSSWQSFGGRSANAHANLVHAAAAGERHGATGYLITDWGDRGHHQPPPVSRFGQWLGAGCAWSGAETVSAPERAERLPDDLSLHAFGDPTGHTGRAAYALGEVGALCGDGASNGTGLFFLLSFSAEPLPHARFPDLSAAGLDRAAAHLASVLQALDGARPSDPDGPLVLDELRWVHDVLAFACRFGRARLDAGPGASVMDLPAATGERLDAELAELAQRHRANWLARSREGGLDESAAWLAR